MNDILSSIKERVSNPLLSSFSIAWLLVNYKFVLAILSGDSLEARYAIINRTFDTTEKILCNGIGWPLFWSLIYIFVLPFITIRVNEYVLKREIKQNEMRDRLRGQVPITEERRDQLLAQINEQREASRIVQNRNEELDSTVRSLRSEIADLKEKYEPKEKPQGQDLAEIFDDNNVVSQSNNILEDTEQKLGADIVTKSDDIDEIINKLSQEAQRLLLAGANDKTGVILAVDTMAGRVIQVNSEKFGEEGNRRSMAQWDDALNQLATLGLIGQTKSRSEGSEIYKIENLGYQVVDRINQQEN